MRNTSKTLWASLIALSVSLLTIWFMLARGERGLPSKVLEKMAANVDSFEQSPAPSSRVPARPDPSSALPQTTTYYRWTDEQGQTGYSAVLPAHITSFKAIVLDRQPEPTTEVMHP